MVHSAFYLKFSLSVSRQDPSSTIYTIMGTYNIVQNAAWDHDNAPRSGSPKFHSSHSICCIIYRRPGQMARFLFLFSFSFSFSISFFFCFFLFLFLFLFFFSAKRDHEGTVSIYTQ